jgi:hypothetical protein
VDEAVLDPKQEGSEMSMWNRDRGGWDPRDLPDRAGDWLRRGVNRLRGEEDVPVGYRGDWRRSGEYGRWEGRRPWGGREPDPRYGLDAHDESGYGSVHYDRDFGYGAFGALRDRGFEDRPYDIPGLRRGRDDQHRHGGYDREMHGRWSPPRGPDPDRYDLARRRGGGMTPGWRGRPRESMGEFPYGRDPYFERGDFRGERLSRGYDSDFDRDRDWF